MKLGKFYINFDRGNIYIVEVQDAFLKWELTITPIHIVLFVLTFFSTTFAGALMQGVFSLSGISKGFIFSLPLLFILISHEFGHLWAMRKYGIRSSFPYFIPAPNIIGTFGAVMVLRQNIYESSKILIIGAAGPIAGFVASIPVIIIGLKMSSVAPEVQEGVIKLGSPIFFSILERFFFEGKEVLLHPVAFAGWIGLFVTAINLIPVGQTDGGHIVFALFPSLHRFISFSVAFLLMIMGILFWYGWIIWGVLTLILGTRGRRYIPRYDITSREKMVAFVCLLIFVLSFILVPVQI